MATRNLYEILGVPRQASQEEIKRAWRKLAKTLHPDVNPGDKRAEERFKEANGAFEVLSDPQKRKLYDELGEDAIRIGFDPERARAYREWSSARRSGGHVGDFGGFQYGEEFDLGEIFSSIFGGGMGARHRGAVGRRPSRGADLSTDVTLTLTEVLKGCERVLELSRERPGGKVERNSITVSIPMGVGEGSRIRVAGQGEQAPGGAGDLYLRVHVAPHPHLARAGNDLEMKLPITVGEALKGGEITCPTLDGEVSLTLPARSQSGRKLRLRGLGLPEQRSGKRGDLYVELQIHVPQELSEAAERSVDELERSYGRGVRSDLKL